MDRMLAPTEQQRRQFEEQGFLVVRNVIDDTLIGSMVDAVERIIDRALDGEFENAFRWVDRDQRVPDFVNDLLTPQKYDPVFGEFLNTVTLPYVEKLLGCPVRCSWLMMLSSGAGHPYGVALHREFPQALFAQER